MAPNTEAKRDCIICCTQSHCQCQNQESLPCVSSSLCQVLIAQRLQGEGGWRETGWDPLKHKQMVGLIGLKFHEHSSSYWHSGLGTTSSFQILPFGGLQQRTIARRRHALYRGPFCTAFMFSLPSSSDLLVVPHFANLPSFTAVRVERRLS